MKLEDAINAFYYEMTLNELRVMNDGQERPEITHNSLLYLDILAYREQCTASELAEALHISKPAVTAKVAELLRQGLVCKTRSQTDRRVQYLTLSDMARDSYIWYDETLRCAVQDIEQRFSQQELARFCEILMALSAHYTLEQHTLQKKESQHHEQPTGKTL